ncbi:MAG: hypothetical protein MK103_08820 [Planctomycetes bacterium]|nr:hypothetical protein [Planctomycetota bacterium]
MGFLRGLGEIKHLITGDLLWLDPRPNTDGFVCSSGDQMAAIPREINTPYPLIVSGQNL